MNLLSHALLSRAEPDDVLTVNVLWDFLSKDLRQDSREFVQRGALIHRVIDRETDTSEEFQSALKLVSRKRESVAGIVVDMGLDYALYREWDFYCPDLRSRIIDTLYERMRETAHALGAEAERLISAMRNGNWFKAYGEPSGLEEVFKRMASRNRFLEVIVGAEEEIVSEVDSYAKLMRSLYPKIQGMVNDL